MKKVYCGIILIGLIGSTTINSIAQDNTTSNRQVMKASQDAVNAIAMYPRDTRKIIFEASEYPEIITKLNDMRLKSQGSFETLVSTLKKDEQEKIWNLTRYDNLISDLAASPVKSGTDIDVILVNYPEEIHKTAIDEHKKNFKLLVQIDQINKSYDTDFELLLNSYPPEVIDAFREIIKMPEVLSILSDHMQYTVIVGNYYKKNPERILHKTDSLNVVLTQKNTQEANDWKQSMNNDPKAQKEYVEAAQEYAQENGYQPDVYNTPMTEFDTNYSSNPYNWWFGYPSWYPDNSWNPNPYWYDWGFYFGSNRQPVFNGLPSSYFMDWYFYYPEHFSKYAELSDNYYNYYDKHRESMNNNSVSHSVNEWRNNNKDIVTNDWDFDKTNRVERFRQYGDMEVSRKKYNTSNPKQQIGRTEYIQKTPNRFYFLNSDVTKSPVIQRNINTTNNQTNLPEPAKRPSVSIPSRNQTAVERTNNVSTPSTNNMNRQRNVNTNVPTRTVNTNVPARSSNSSQMRNAEQYNQNTWKQPQQQVQPRQQPQAQPQVQPRQNTPAPPVRQTETRQVQQPQPVRQNTPAPSNDKRK